LKTASAALREHPEDAQLWNVGAGAAFALGLTRDAEQFWKVAIARDPDYAEAHHNLGVVHFNRNDLDGAARCFERALAVAPGHPQALNNLGAVLMKQERFAKAEPLLKRAVALDPGNAEAHNNLGLALMELGQLDEARASFDRALAVKPRLAEALASRGKLCIESGELDAAIGFLDAAIEAKPDFGAAYQDRSLITRAVRGDPWIGRLEAAWARRASLPVEAVVALDFAMGKTREELGEYPAAFEAYAQANRLHGAAHPFDEASEERTLAAAIATFTPDLYTQPELSPAAPVRAAHAPGGQRVPIFVVGMPRSGTTLIEQVLAGHPDVLGAGELRTLGELATTLPEAVPAGADRAAWLGRLRALGEEYLARVWHASGARRFVVDKMPGNYRYLGLIPLMIPGARLISVRRDPLDTCLSCYATPFREGHEYSNDLRLLARQYLRYQRLMQHWAAVLPAGGLIEVSYEAVVADLPGEARRMLDYVGLPWDENCLTFHESRRAVRTASVAQVRQPLYTRSIARWKRFETQLAPLRALLAPVLTGDVTNRAVPGSGAPGVQVRGFATDKGPEQEPPPAFQGS
jgi:tetratricopeptide (TPR) repeat protein